MTKNEITPELLRQLLIYDPETGLFQWKPRDRKWFKNDQAFGAWNTKYAGKPAFTANSHGYRAGSVFKTLLLAHRVAYAMAHGAWPIGDTDHINGNRHDNRIANLREVTRAENMRNAKTPSTNTSGALGVRWHKHSERWYAHIGVGGKPHHIGCFTNFDDAVAARKQAEIDHGFHENHGRHL